MEAKFAASLKKLIMKISNKISLFCVNSRNNRIIKKYKYVHIMFNDKFNKPFVDFLNSSFNKNEHIVLCKRIFKNQPFPQDDNVIEFSSLFCIKFSKNEKVICHSLFDDELVNYLYRHKDVLRNKAYWMIWGGDLYDAVRDKKNDFVRKNFKGYISDTDGDCDVARLRYKSKPCVFNAGYTFPITKGMIAAAKKINHDYVQIQINNSCDKTTLEMLDILSRFKDEDIRIVTILSYGDLEFKSSIIDKGSTIFGDKFTFLDKYLSPCEYTQFIAQNDVLILCQNRQQGLGNCFANLALGTKVYIKKDITTYNHFNSRNIRVFDTNEIVNIEFPDFFRYNYDTRVRNMRLVDVFFNGTYLRQLWNEVFES